MKNFEEDSAIDCGSLCHHGLRIWMLRMPGIRKFSKSKK